MIAEANGCVVDVSGLSRRFGRTVALDDVSLEVPRGAVFGIVGENAAGKTTLIKHILGLFKAKTGRVRVFGLDPVRDSVGVLSRVGYLSEDRDLPDWMRIGEMVRYLRPFTRAGTTASPKNCGSGSTWMPVPGSRPCRRVSVHAPDCWRRWHTGPSC